MKSAITLSICCSLAVGASAFAQSATPAVAPDAATDSAAQAGLTALEDATNPVSAQTVSAAQVRIVRLSEVRGDVELNRGGSQIFDTAFMNLPVVAGAALRTKHGIAEVEFEDNSSLRLTPESQVEFPTLGRSASGATTTAVKLLHGTLYVSLAESKVASDFTVNVGNRSIMMTPSTHLRLDLGTSPAKMVVYQGTATISGPSGSLVVTKKKAVSFDLASSGAPEFAQVGEATPYDKWDRNSVDYHKARTVLANGLAGSPYSYGLNDLNYYGAFSDVGGCGTMWRPYLVDASFDPYASGVWSWYPGQGYSWVSLYPWGWAPFHYGSWDYCPAGGGWGWRPQGKWRSVLNHPLPIRGPVRPHPPLPPRPGQPTLVPVNMKLLQASRQGEDGKFVFRAGSAGLGVPRGVFNNLGTISQHTETRGFVATSLSERQTQAIYMTPTRSSTASSSYSASSANTYSARSGSTSAPTSSSGFTSSHSSSSVSAPASSSFSSSSISTSAPVATVSSAASVSGAHH